MDDWKKGNQPNLFILKKNRSGDIVSDNVCPEELLIEHYKGRSWKDSAAEAFAGGAVRLTKDDNWGKAVLATSKKFGAFKDKEAFFSFKDLPFSEEYQTQLHFDLKQEAVKKLQQVTKDGRPQLEVLVTGGTGFLGMDLLKMLAPDANVKKVYCIVWDKEMGSHSPEQFKDKIMQLLDITDPAQIAKYEVLPGDVTEENMGLGPDALKKLESKVTHLVHLAASVSFEDPYDVMFRANVTATQVALKFAKRLQDAPNSLFVNFISTETCYIHGRNVEPCREERLVFPRDYYNNHYELTKALGDLYCRHFTLENKLRVISLCPAITVGDYRTGNNHGDTKVVNAAANAFGRIGLEMQKQPWLVQQLVSRLLSFPGTAEAKLNLVSVDRISNGLHNALTRPLATGERIHLGGSGVRTGTLMDVFHEEIGLPIHLVNPVFHRIMYRPLLRFILQQAGMERTYEKLEMLFTIFSSYAEWGQPVHELGNDERFLGLPVPRPELLYLVRSMTRHNKHVQEWGKVRDKAVVSARERTWAQFVEELEKKHGTHIGALSPKVFSEEVKKLTL